MGGWGCRDRRACLRVRKHGTRETEFRTDGVLPIYRGELSAALMGGMGKYSCPCLTPANTGKRLRLPMPPKSRNIPGISRACRRRLDERVPRGGPPKVF